MGWIERLFRRKRTQFAGSIARRAPLPQRPRLIQFESMERRQLLATVPLVVGVTYQELDSGADLHGDRITIQFQGGAPGTQLTHLVLNGDQNAAGYSVGDMIFDTVKGGLGADEAAPLAIVSRDGIDDVRWRVEDGTSQLTFDFTGFDAGETLVLTIDVDEIQQFDPADTNVAHKNEGIDPIASGVEFQGSKLTATFRARDYLDATGTSEFRNLYDPLFDGTTLLRSTTNPAGLPSDNEDGLRDRSAGTTLPLVQTPNLVSLCGYVFVDADADGVRDAGEAGIGGVALQVIPVTTIAAQANVSLVTSADGTFCATGLMPGVYRIVETQPAAYLDGLDAPGRVGSDTRGLAQNPGDEIRQIELRGGDAGVDYSFGENLPSRVAGTVYHDRNVNGVRDAGEEGIGGVRLQLRDAAGLVAEQTTAADGSYRFERLPAGTYRLVETQPDGWQDGLDAPGTIGGRVVGRAVNPGDLIDEVLLSWGEAGIEYNFGEWKFASLDGVVRSTTGPTCESDPSAVPLAGVRLELVDSAGVVKSTTTTDSAGRYRFEQVVPGEYTVREQQPGEFFTNGQRAGSAGGDASTPNVIRQIRLTSAQSAVDYDFCEAPPASISGIVFRDGPAFVTPDGKLPADWQQQRDGQFTADDEPLSGVFVELRDGTTGLPLTADDVLPGVDLSSLRVRTDGAGRFLFTGLRGGRAYALYEVQPASYVDGLDTAGSTGGYSFNPGDAPPPAVVDALERDPLGDALVGIPVAPGQTSSNNNFSELEVLKKKPTPPPEPPVEPPPYSPLPPLPPPVVAYFPTEPPPPPIIPVALPGYNVLPTPPTIDEGFTQGPVGMTWHLSVVNAGSPRGDGLAFTVDVAWKNAAFASRMKLLAQRMREGEWTMRLASPLRGGDGQYRRGLFGLADGTPVAGDFNGDGQAEFGVYYQGEWFIDINANGQWDDVDLWAQLGGPGDQPVVGDWDGDGKDDIGVFGPEWPGDARAIGYETGLPDFSNDRETSPKNLPPRREEATNGLRLLRNSPDGEPRADLIDHVFRFGAEEDQPVTGDWDGDGIHTIGIFRDGRWTIDTDGDGELGRRDRIVDFGRPGDKPVVGDFDGDGIDELGVFRQGRWIVDMNHDGVIDASDLQFDLGAAGDTPVVNDFDGDGVDEPGVYRAVEPETPRTANQPSE